MEKKLKIAEFAQLVGVTPKTVYKMIEREELKTVSEKVNNRTTTLVVTDLEEIEQFRVNYDKSRVSEGECNEMLTVNEGELKSSNHSQTNNNMISMSEVVEQIMNMSNEYNNRIAELNNELVTAKSQMLLLEDKSRREGMYIQEINELRTENKGLRKNNNLVLYTSITVIASLLLVIVGYFTFNIAISEKKEPANVELIGVK